MSKIYQIGDGQTFLEPDRLRQLSSVYAVHESPRASDKYNFFSTANILSMLMKQNWFPVIAQEQRVRTEGRVGFQKHMIRLRRKTESMNMLRVGDLVPEIILSNSHDTSSAQHFMFGIWRFACLNGLFVSEAEFATIRIPHMGFTEEDVIDASYRIIEDAPRIMDKVNDYRAIELSSEERFAFAQSALVTKFANDDETKVKEERGLVVIGDRSFDPQKLLLPRREADVKPTLWNTFNIIQEKFIKGNTYEQTSRINPTTGRNTIKTKVQGIHAIDETIRVNRGLWQLVELVRELKAPATV